MLCNDSKELLDDILSRWHRWAKGFSPLAVIAVDPAFRGEINRSGWDSQEDITDALINSKIMEAVDFQVSEITEPYRSAIHENARNCCTGHAVWRSPRLPGDPIERGKIITDARWQLMKKLISSGVL